LSSLATYLVGGWRWFRDI